MITDNMNPELDDFFAEARVETPEHSFSDTKKTLLAGLAIGGISLVGAKIIASSILKSKFFIMSISAVTILSSAVLVYTTGIKPNAQISEKVSHPTSEVMAVASPNGDQLPDNLFVMSDMPINMDVEPDDSVIVVKMDSVENIEQIIMKVMHSSSMEHLMDSIGDIMELIKNIDIEIDEDDMAEIKVMIKEFSEDSVKMTELINMATSLEKMGHDIETQLMQVQNGQHVIMLNRTVSNGPELHKRVFTITNQTTDLDLEAFNKQATAAGIDVRYDCTVWASKVKKLNMRLEINNDHSKQVTDIHIRKVKRNESFVHNIIWFENNEGQAVKFNETNECEIERHNHDCEEH